MVPGQVVEFEDEQMIAPEVGGEAANRTLDEGQIRFPVRAERRRHAYQDGIGLVGTRELSRCFKPARRHLIADELMRQMPNRAAAIIQGGDARMIDVEAENTEARLRRRAHKWQPDVAEPGNPNHPLPGSDARDQRRGARAIAIFGAAILDARSPS